ncbi:HAD hydrolase family protein [Candidatus Sumerlaeota bacterium]|nr:HAD hydrolase family protein [Candidatus Sumerlaeota bacterium]
MHNIIAFIPICNLSESLQHYIFKPIAGKPLLYWPVTTALGCDFIKRIVIYCDDTQTQQDSLALPTDPRIQFLNSSGKISTGDSLYDTNILEYAESNDDFEAIISIQALSPLLTSKDLQTGYDKFNQSDIDSVLSVVRQKIYFWKETLEGAQTVNFNIEERSRGHNITDCLMEDKAFYITSREALLRTRCLVSGQIGIVEMNPASCLNIDTPENWAAIENTLLRNKYYMHDKRDFASRAAKIKLFITDIDGVLTDSGMYYSENGDEIKKFNVRDGMGFNLLSNAGIATAILTSEDRRLNQRRAAKLKVDHLIQGAQDKLTLARDLTESLGLDLEQVAFIGDDINDTELLLNVGLPCCPADAIIENQRAAAYICKKNGGAGCVREIIDLILKYHDSGSA